MADGEGEDVEGDGEADECELTGAGDRVRCWEVA